MSARGYSRYRITILKGLLLFDSILVGFTFLSDNADVANANNTFFRITMVLRQVSFCSLLLSTCFVLIALQEEARVIAWLEEDEHAKTAVAPTVMDGYHSYIGRWRIGDTCVATARVLNAIGLLFLVAASAFAAQFRLGSSSSHHIWALVIVILNTMTGLGIFSIFVLYYCAYHRAKRTQRGEHKLVWWSLWVPEKARQNIDDIEARPLD